MCRLSNYLLTQSVYSIFVMCMLQTLFDDVTSTTTDDAVSAALSQIISVMVVHGESVCCIAAQVHLFTCRYG